MYIRSTIAYDLYPFEQFYKEIVYPFLYYIDVLLIPDIKDIKLEGENLKERKLCNMHILNFLQSLLDDPQEKYNDMIVWENRTAGVFRIILPNELALLWGQHKNSNSMTYDKMSRALRYYYRDKILSKCGRLAYRFHWDNPLFTLSAQNVKISKEDLVAMGHFLDAHFDSGT